VLNSERSKRRGRVFVSPSLYITAEHVYFSSSAVSSHFSSTSKIVDSVFSMRKTFASISIILLSMSICLRSVSTAKVGGRERALQLDTGGYTDFSAKSVEVRFSVNLVGVLGLLSSDCTKDKNERVHKKANLAIIYYQSIRIRICYFFLFRFIHNMRVVL